MHNHAILNHRLEVVYKSSSTNVSEIDAIINQSINECISQGDCYSDEFDNCNSCEQIFGESWDCCDMEWFDSGLTCAELISDYNWTCNYCVCPGDLAICEEQGLIMCDDYSCAETLEDCGSELSCEDQGLVTCPDGDCAGDISYCTENCDEGYVEDCHDENDCLLESWIGDGYPDCWPGTMWDLACYDNDGGDCDGYTTCEMQSLITCPNGECVESLEDCSDSTECVEGYVTDCSGDGDCCWDNWIGDGWADCSDQQYGCDLTCYDCDGGDCDCDDDCCSPGDYNCDTSIDVLDIVAIVNCVLEDTDCPCGNLDDNGAVNVLDIVLLVNMILGGTDSSSVTDIDGNVYETIQIGAQLWMAENLKVTHFNNGDEIPTGYSASEWTTIWDDAYAVYDDDLSNVESYGNLYNWYAVDDSRGICPENYHIPTDDEWYILLEYLGGASYGSGENWIIAGGKMKDVGTIEDGDGLWYAPNEGANNESDFTAIPAGFRLYDGQYYERGYYSIYWSSTAEYYSDAFFMWYLLHDDSRLYRGLFDSQTGLSVRCLRD